MKILKKEMKLLKLTSQDLAEKINVSNTAVSLWLSGKYFPKKIHVEKLIKIGFTEEAAIFPAKEVKV